MVYVLFIIIWYFMLSMFQHWISQFFFFLWDMIWVLFYPIDRVSANIVFVQPRVQTAYWLLVFIFAFKIIYKYIINKT